MNTRKTRTVNDTKKGALKGRTRTNKGAKAASKSGTSTTGKTTGKDTSKSAEKPKTAKGQGRFADFKDRVKKGDPLPSFSDEVRLNKYLSNAGICSRRDADVLIKT
ncbi:MAG: rRNA pseudouridine synthase, partial [Crocinitomicaceae bacterium]